MGKDIVKANVSKEFRLRVGDAERNKLVDQHNQTLNEIDEKVQKAADTAAAFREEIKGMRETERELRAQIDRGKPVVFDVLEHRDYGKNEIWWTLTKDQHDLKKGKEMDRRQMTPEDDQPILPSGNEPDDEDGQ